MQDSESALTALKIDHDLFRAIVQGTRAGLQMANILPHPVGCSRISANRHPVTVIVGLTGHLSGNLALNFSEEAMLYIAGKILGEPQHQLTDDCADAIMEVGNIIAGSAKTSLEPTRYQISAISLPSLILGASHSMLFARGIEAVSVEHELRDMPLRAAQSRIFSTTISWLAKSGL